MMDTHTPSLAAPSAPPRVLVADPDDDMRMFYRDSLKLVGFNVVEARDGRDALEKALVQQPTLVITGLRLPLVDGFALCEILRRDRTTANVPILVVTIETRPDELNRARKAGADAVLMKPTTREAILNEVRILIAGVSDQRLKATTLSPGKSSTLSDCAEGRPHSPLSKSHARFTTMTPPDPPPDLTCPSCDRPLKYERSHIGGVSSRSPEQWDDYVCPACGTFEYRQRTRKLRRLG
jgi:CheY-like chemotaxis protein